MQNAPRKLFKLVLLLLFILAVGGILGVMGAEIKDEPVDSPHVTSIFDAMPGVNTEDARMALEMLMRNIVVRHGKQFRVRLDFLMDFGQAADKINADRYDLVVLPGLDYLQIKSKVALTPRLVLSKVEKPTEPLVLVTQHNETLETLSKKDPRILIIDVGRAGESAKLWLDTVLLEAGLGPSHQFFTEIRRSQKPSRSILPVFFGQVDACVVPESALNVMNELNPQIGRQVRILKRSENLVNLLLCATSWADQEDVEMVVAEGIDAFHDPKSRQALTMVQMNRFYPFQPEHMAATANLYKRHQRAMEKWGR
jgi:ABC-type phosphate/phosphonate transport system substrate-binding protein